MIDFRYVINIKIKVSSQLHGWTPKLLFKGTVFFPWTRNSQQYSAGQNQKFRESNFVETLADIKRYYAKDNNIATCYCKMFCSPQLIVEVTLMIWLLTIYSQCSFIGLEKQHTISYKVDAHALLCSNLCWRIFGLITSLKSRKRAPKARLVNSNFTIIFMNRTKPRCWFGNRYCKWNHKQTIWMVM